MNRLTAAPATTRQPNLDRLIDHLGDACNYADVDNNGDPTEYATALDYLRNPSIKPTPLAALLDQIARDDLGIRIGHSAVIDWRKENL